MKLTYISKNIILRFAAGDVTKAYMRGDIKYLCHNSEHTYFKSLRDYVEFNKVECIPLADRISLNKSEEIHPTPVICKNSDYYVVYASNLKMDCGDLLLVNGKLSNKHGLIKVTYDRKVIELLNLKCYEHGNMYLCIESNSYYLEVGPFVKDVDYHPFFVRNPHYKE